MPLNVLLFHELRQPPERNSVVVPALFVGCLETIAEHRLAVKTLAEWGGGATLPASGGVCVTFDDGWETDITVALPALARHGMRATFFVITGRMGTSGCLSWEQVRDLADAGMEIGSHSRSHPDLRSLTRPALDEELGGSRRELEDWLGRSVPSLSIPHGFFDGRVREASVRAGYRHLCVSRPGLNPLPLPAGAPVRRNALHRLVAPGQLRRFVNPRRGTLLGRQAAYAARAGLKRLLPGEKYEAFRRLLLGTARAR